MFRFILWDSASTKRRENLLDKLQSRIIDIDKSFAPRRLFKNDLGTRLVCADGESKCRPFPSGRTRSDGLTGQARPSISLDAQTRPCSLWDAEHRHQFVGRSRLQ